MTLAVRSLADCEAVIEAGIGTFVEVGKALMEIRDLRLYRETHSTFEDYCQERWGWTRRQANRQIEAAAVVEILGPMGPKQPANERQARALAPLKEDPERMAAVWGEVLEQTNGQPSARRIEAAVAGRPLSDFPGKRLPANPSHLIVERAVHALSGVVTGLKHVDPAAMAQREEAGQWATELGQSVRFLSAFVRNLRGGGNGN